MAAEIQVKAAAGQTLYCQIRNNVGQIWNGVTFVAYASGDINSYAVSMTEQGAASGYYTATFPASVAAGVYNIVALRQVGGAPAESDPGVATGVFQWNGSAQFPLSDLATSGQVAQFSPIKVARGTMVNPFPIFLRSSVDHVTPFTSGVVSGQIMRGSGAWGPLQSGAFIEKGQGFFDLQALTSGDTNAGSFSLYFTAVGISGGSSDPLPMSFITQRTSGN